MNRTLIRVSRVTAASLLACLTLAAEADAAPTLDDYRQFRALTIDLVGRTPTRDEVAAFEAPGFNLDAWIDERLQGVGYGRRLARVYFDQLRLEFPPQALLVSEAVNLRRIVVVGPDGKDLPIYFRPQQRRVRVETDADFCLTPDETGLAFPPNLPPEVYPSGAPRTRGIPVTQALLDQYTVVVKPWWLYADYKAANPSDRYQASTWSKRFPGYVPATGLLNPGAGPTDAIRICKEEAQSGETGHIYKSGRNTRVTGDGGTFPFGRRTFPPVDDTLAKTRSGEVISCATQTGVTHAVDCGCGPGLERCTPSTMPRPDNATFVLPSRNVIGVDEPTDAVTSSMSTMMRLLWSEEARHFMEHLFHDDMDVRDLVKGRWTEINGPLATFYKSYAPATCCNAGLPFNQVDPEPLFLPSAVPAELTPHALTTWRTVADRGPHAAGILTMPIFLMKYGTRRARAHAVYSTFLCKEFIAPPGLALPPSSEVNLMRRPGCSSCHATLEPLSAFFTRIQESSWNYLPADKFPLSSTTCKLDAQGRLSATCRTFYDSSFATTTSSTLRGAYPDVIEKPGQPANSDRGPVGLAEEISSSPEFATCVAENVASSFLGRALSAEDEPMKKALAEALVGSGFRARALVRALLRSNAYRRANNLSSEAWRTGGGL